LLLNCSTPWVLILSPWIWILVATCSNRSIYHMQCWHKIFALLIETVSLYQ
jgi:hypothetical protein